MILFLFPKSRKKRKKLRIGRRPPKCGNLIRGLLLKYGITKYMKHSTAYKDKLYINPPLPPPQFREDCKYGKKKSPQTLCTQSQPHTGLQSGITPFHGAKHPSQVCSYDNSYVRGRHGSSPEGAHCQAGLRARSLVNFRNRRLRANDWKTVNKKNLRQYKAEPVKTSNIRMNTYGI